MKFQEKLRRRAAEVNQAKAARAVGLSENAISSYVARGSLPRADIALKIARALQVPLEWLLDDEQEWPPPRADRPAVELLSDDELMEELARRYRRMVLDKLRWIEAAQRSDWAAVARALYEQSPSEELPPALARELDALWLLQTGLYGARTFYDPQVYAESRHAEMPGRDRAPEEVTMEAVLRRHLAWREKNPHFQLVEEYMRILGDHRSGSVERARADYQKAVQRLKKIDGGATEKRSGK